MNCNIILPLHLGFPSGLLPSYFPTKMQYTLLICHMRAIFPAHLILFDSIAIIIFDEEEQLRKSSSCNILHLPLTSSLLDPNIILNTLVSRTLKLCSLLQNNVFKRNIYVRYYTGVLIIIKKEIHETVQRNTMFSGCHMVLYCRCSVV